MLPSGLVHLVPPGHPPRPPPWAKPPRGPPTCAKHPRGPPPWAKPPPGPPVVQPLAPCARVKKTLPRPLKRPAPPQPPLAPPPRPSSSPTTPKKAKLATLPSSGSGSGPAPTVYNLEAKSMPKRAPRVPQTPLPQLGPTHYPLPVEPTTPPKAAAPASAPPSPTTPPESFLHILRCRFRLI